jgi:hypothetical protein
VLTTDAFDEGPDRFKFAEGSLIEKMRLLCQQMPGADKAIGEKALAYKPPTEDLLFHTVDDGRYTRRIYRRNNLRDAEK